MANPSEGHRRTSQFFEAKFKTETGTAIVIKRRPSSHTKGAELISAKPPKRESEGPKPVIDVHVQIAEGLEADVPAEESSMEALYFDPAEGE